MFTAPSETWFLWHQDKPLLGAELTQPCGSFLRSQLNLTTLISICHCRATAVVIPPHQPAQEASFSCLPFVPHAAAPPYKAQSRPDPSHMAHHSSGRQGHSQFQTLSLLPPQPDHFVQDPAVLREKAEARRMAFLARKG
jgi:hypothetical protein